jgi:hypothetical protein
MLHDSKLLLERSRVIAQKQVRRPSTTKHKKRGFVYLGDSIFFKKKSVFATNTNKSRNEAKPEKGDGHCCQVGSGETGDRYG